MVLDKLIDLDAEGEVVVFDQYLTSIVLSMAN